VQTADGVYHEFSDKIVEEAKNVFSNLAAGKRQKRLHEDKTIQVVKTEVLGTFEYFESMHKGCTT